MLGHASAAMTLDVYADLFDSDHGDLADRLDAAVRLRADAARPNGAMVQNRLRTECGLSPFLARPAAPLQALRKPLTSTNVL